MNKEFKVDPNWTDKDSKITRFRQLYESRSFLDAYAAHTDLRAQDDPKGAIGRSDEWESHGKLQLQFLISRGLQSTHRLLDVGCGPGRAARRLVPFLDAGNYTGIDISESVLQHAVALAQFERWDSKRPTFMRNSDLDLDEEPFDFIWAHSVFTHLPGEQIEKMVSNAGDRLTRDGQFLFTYKRGTEPERTGLKQFRYPFTFFKTAAQRCGMTATMLDMVWPASQRTGVFMHKT